MYENIHRYPDDDKAPETILVVEDDESLRILIQRKLNRAGFFAEGISNGMDALNRLAIKKYGLLLLDYTLPDFSGEQFVSRLIELNCCVPFIVATGQENEKIMYKMMNLGAREYLVKDNNFLDSLIDSVHAVLG